MAIGSGCPSGRGPLRVSSPGRASGRRPLAMALKKGDLAITAN